MSDLTEEEQVEQLRAWWAQYGIAVIIGVLAFAGGFIGVTQWRAGNQAHAEAASLLYDKVMESATSADITLLVQRRNQLLEEFSDTPYASQAGLQLAALYVQRGETDKAETVLGEVLVAEKDTLLTPIVATRLARLQLYRDDAETALATLDAVSAGEFGPMLDVVKGDALTALGRKDEAADAYAAAIAGDDTQQMVDPNIVNMKIAALTAVISPSEPAVDAVEAADLTSDDTSDEADTTDQASDTQ